VLARLRIFATDALRSPESAGAAGQGLRYAVVGCVVAFVYLATTTLAAELLGLAFELALALGFATATAVHFTLQRTFVWVHHGEFAVGALRQLGRYMLLIACQYGLTVVSTSTLPGAIGVPVIAVYYATVLTLSTVNFIVFRSHVFHPTVAGAREGSHASGGEIELMTGAREGRHSAGVVDAGSCSTPS
jgi:putative flippase GtrA